MTRVRWNNIGISKVPVNPAVPPVSTVSAEVFAKCCTAAGFDLGKALEAGYGTDAATLTDGAALRTQSLDGRVQAPLAPGQIRDRLAKRLHPASLAAYLTQEHGIPEDEALDHARSFLRDTLTRTGANHVRF